MKINNSPKILLLDIETSPNLAYVWGKYEQDVIDYKSEWHILCWSAKWAGEKKVMTAKLNDYPGYKKDKSNDFSLVKDLWNLFDKADIIIAHNGDDFDIKKSYARFLAHGLMPPKPAKSIDTKKVAKRYFNFNSNKLDDLGRYLKLGRKVKHHGFSMWLGCMNGDKESWNEMIRYNKQDVLLLERVYNKFLPFIRNHPNISLYKGKPLGCPNCGSVNLNKRGFAVTQRRSYQRVVCTDCGAWSRLNKCIGIKSERGNL